MTTSRRSRDDDRGASEVISVVLMVAVTIVLAAMVGTVLLNIVTEVETNPLAGVNSEFDSANDSVEVTFTTAQSPGTTLEVNLYHADGTAVAGSPKNLSEVGNRVRFTGLTDGDRYRLVVVARDEGKRSVVVDETDTV